MRMSIVACAVLGGSAACAAAQNHAAPAGSAGATAVKEYVCTDKCRDGARPSAGAAQDAPALFTVETVSERDQAPKSRKGGKGGALTVGRQYSLEYTALNDVGDPFHGGLAGASLPSGPRAGDSMNYQGRFAGLSTGAAWDKGDIDGSPSGRAWGMAAKNSILAANMRFGWGTAYAAYSASRGWGSSPLFNPDNPYGAGIASTPSTNSRDVLAGVAVPLGHATTLLASYIRKNDRDPANRDARQIAVGASYAVSRRMDFYAACSRIQHLNGAPAGAPTGNGLAVNVGMRRSF